MKLNKKLLTLALIAIMMLAMAVTVYAAGNSNTITINNSDSSVQHTYEAYQVFSGTVETVNEKEQLTGIQWGDGVDSAALLTALKADTTIGSAFAGAATAADVAKVLEAFEDDSAQIDAFAAIVGKNLGTAKGTSTQTASPYTITGLPAGYYFVKDQDASVTEPGETYSKYMLEVVKDVEIEAKDDQLTPEKKIVQGEEKVDATSAAIGDEIQFEVTINIPDMDGYQNYYFQMSDTMCKGLTFKQIDSVKVGDTTVTENTGTAGTTYVKSATTNAAGETTLTVTFDNFIQYKGTSGKVTLLYTATLNDQAEIEKVNENTVKFTYSNDPNHSGESEYETVTGQTPEDKTQTYTTKLIITKIGDGESSLTLEGAEFKLSGSALNSTIVTGIKYEKSSEASPYTAGTGETIESGTYYKLLNGSYTTTAPTTATESQYATPTTDTYVKVSYTKTVTAAEAVDKTGITGSDGTLTFTGLNAGTYTLTELTAPNGYNLMTPNPVTIVISWDDESKTFSVGEGDTAGTVHDNGNGTFTLTIDDKSGSELPSTGGMGTRIFYVVGSILVLAAGVILVVRRRAAAH